MRRAKLSGFHLHYGSRSLWLYRVSAAQDVVQQLILRLIHFLLNCLQTAAVIQPVPTNPRHCLAHSSEELGHVEAPHSSTSALSNCVCVTAQRDAGTVSVGKGSFKSFRWESIDALKLPRYHLELCIELNLLPNRVLARWISLHNTNAIRDYSALLQSRFLSCTFVQNSYKKWDFLRFGSRTESKNEGNWSLIFSRYSVWKSASALKNVDIFLFFSCIILVNITEIICHLGSVRPTLSVKFVFFKSYCQK